MMESRRGPRARAEIQGKVLLRVLDACGLDCAARAALLSKEGLADPPLRALGATLPLLAYLRIFDRLAAHLARPMLGLQLAHQIGPELVGAAGYLFVNAPTLEAGLIAYSESVFSIQGVTELRFDRTAAPTVAYTITDDAMQPRRQDVEFSVGHVHALIRRYLGGTYAPEEVHFEHQASGSLASYDNVFGCPVYFEQPRNAIILRRDDLLRSSPDADAGLAAILRHYLQLVDHRDRVPDSWGERVNALLSGEEELIAPRADRIAARLGLSEDALQRRLQAEGASLRRLTRAKRMSVARRQLLETDLSIVEIAQGLGYAETASFTRAFAAETGIPPSRFRRQGRVERRQGAE